MNVAPALARMSIGVEWRRIDYIWQPVAALPGRPQAEPWTVLAADGDAATFYVGAADLALYRTETGQYRDNLASGAPSLWVALRPTGVEPPYSVVAVTADPAEGESFTQAGDDLVGAVPMPRAVRDLLETFIAEHHVEQPFFKRERDRADPPGRVRPAPIGKRPAGEKPIEKDEGR